MIDDVITQLSCGKELWIAADDFGGIILIGWVWEVNIVSQNFQNTLWTQCALHQSFQGIQALTCLVFVLHLLPLIEIFKWRKRCTQFCLCSIADNSQNAIFHQIRDVAHIASANLGMGIINRGIYLGRILQLDDTDWNTIHKEHHVWATVLASLLHYKLVDTAEDITLRALEIDVLQLKRQTFCRSIIIAVTIEIECVLESIIFILSAHISDVSHDAIHLILREILGAISAS